MDYLLGREYSLIVSWTWGIFRWTSKHANCLFRAVSIRRILKPRLAYINYGEIFITCQARTQTFDSAQSSIQHLYNVNQTKERFTHVVSSHANLLELKKVFTWGNSSTTTGLVLLHQHGRCFIVLKHQYCSTIDWQALFTKSEEDDYHQQQFVSELLSPGLSHYTNYQPCECIRSMRSATLNKVSNCSSVWIALPNVVFWISSSRFYQTKTLAL